MSQNRVDKVYFHSEFGISENGQSFRKDPSRMSCVFCDKITNNDDIEEWNTLGVFHFEPLDPVTPGHRIFIVREHVEEARLSSGITGLLFTAATQYAQKHDEDFNLIVNSGPAASQTVRHLHIHYVPRRKDDGLNLPWTGQQKGQFGGYLGGTSPNPHSTIPSS